MGKRYNPAKARRRYLRKKPNARKNISHRLGNRKAVVKRMREIVMQAYGKRCNCCGESNEMFLQIDHVNNDGNAERGNNRKQDKVLRKIIQDGFPDRYQILCANCNWGKERNGGICPHVTIMDNPLAHRTESNGVTKPKENTLPLFEFLGGTG